MYDQHTRGMTTTRHRSLVGRGGRKAVVRDKSLAHTKKMSEHLISRIQEKDLEHIDLAAKPLDHFYEVMKAKSMSQLLFQVIKAIIIFHLIQSFCEAEQYMKQTEV